jgi:hypothetical protein
MNYLELKAIVDRVQDRGGPRRDFLNDEVSSFNYSFQRGNRFVAEVVSNIIYRRVANMVDLVVVSRFPLGSLERLEVTERILNELK